MGFNTTFRCVLTVYSDLSKQVQRRYFILLLIMLLLAHNFLHPFAFSGRYSNPPESGITWRRSDITKKLLDDFTSLGRERRVHGTGLKQLIYELLITERYEIRRHGPAPLGFFSFGIGAQK